jgi:hypothetical protein
MKSGNFTSQRWGQTPEITRNLGNKKKELEFTTLLRGFLFFSTLRRGSLGT